VGEVIETIHHKIRSASPDDEEFGERARGPCRVFVDGRIRVNPV
jgi:hypothetical protein